MTQFAQDFPIDNYDIHPEYQVLTQIKREPFEYTDLYIHAYDKLDCHSISKIRFDTIEKYIKRKPLSVLDYGYGNGDFLTYCFESGVKFTYGYDISPVDPPSTAIKITDLSKGFYDVCSFWDSCEHTEDIGVTIKSLPPHNYVAISLPWCRNYTNYFSFTDTFNSEWFFSWKHRKPNEHLWHFTDWSLDYFMTQCGYKTIFMGCPEDEIRKSVDQWPNILTGIFEKK